MILLLDVGNSRLKFAFWQRSGLAQAVMSEQQAVVHHGRISDALEKILQHKGLQRAEVSRVLVSSVAGELAEKAITTFCRQHLTVNPEFARTRKTFKGFTVAYEQPSRLGVDRWLAMLAARKLEGLESRENSPVCVIDSGSALTIDVVSAKGGHRGGFIIPGLRLMYDSLLNNTQEVYADTPSFDDIDWGKSTNQAVANGALFAIVSVVKEACRRFSEQEARVLMVLSGGDADILFPLLSDTCGCKKIPDLVLRGLIELFEV
ncbi:MAG TPA: type III pantothenate kinase [Pseudomonadales bacterium]